MIYDLRILIYDLIPRVKLKLYIKHLLDLLHTNQPIYNFLHQFSNLLRRISL